MNKTLIKTTIEKVIFKIRSTSAEHYKRDQEIVAELNSILYQLKPQNDNDMCMTKAMELFKANGLRNSTLGLKIFIAFYNNKSKSVIDIRKLLLTENPSLSLTTVYQWNKRLNKARML